MVKIKVGESASVELYHGQKVQVGCDVGPQVVDTWAFNLNDYSEFLSMEHSRSALYKLLFKPGDELVTNLFEPVLKICADTSSGFHDTLHAACSPGSYKFYVNQENHPNCQDNLKQQLHRRGYQANQIPCPWNLFEHGLVDRGMKLHDEATAVTPGQYIELEAKKSLLMVFSACPSEIGGINGEKPGGALIKLLD